MRSKQARSRVALVSLLSLVLALTLVGTASAWRAPTPRERRVLTRLAKRTPHGSTAEKKIRVGEIRVSTIAPWATAEVSLDFPMGPEGAVAIMHKSGHRWHLLTSSGESEGWCYIKMTHRVERDLELPIC